MSYLIFWCTFSTFFCTAYSPLPHPYVPHSACMFDITIELTFAGINMFLARLRIILARALRGLKWALRRAKNIFMPKNFNSITIIITLKPF